MFPWRRSKKVTTVQLWELRNLSDLHGMQMGGFCFGTASDRTSHDQGRRGAVTAAERCIAACDAHTRHNKEAHSNERVIRSWGKRRSLHQNSTEPLFKNDKSNWAQPCMRGKHERHMILGWNRRIACTRTVLVSFIYGMVLCMAFCCPELSVSIFSPIGQGCSCMSSYACKCETCVSLLLCVHVCIYIHMNACIYV